MLRPTAKDLPPDLLRAVERCAGALADHGVQAWLVGGAVRDLALGRAPDDADLASAAVPAQIAKWFPAAIGVGAAFGTMVLPPAFTGGPSIELTTFRSEREYSDGRHPDSVEYSDSPEVDARRRDFTCNALYLDPLTDELRDPTGGLADLEQGRLRAIGEPAERFEEDALRVLRLARFAARFGLEIEAGTARAARSKASLLRGISAERTAHELDGMFERPGSARAIAELEALGALPFAWPALTRVEHARSAALFEALPDPPGPVLGLAALLVELDDAGADPAAALDALKPSRERRTAVLDLLRARAAIALDGGTLPQRAALLRRLRATQDGLVFALAAATAELLNRPTSEQLGAARACAAEVPADQRHPKILLDAAALMAAGVERGPRLGRLLAELEDAQLEGQVSKRDEAEAWLRKQL